MKELRARYPIGDVPKCKDCGKPKSDKCDCFEKKLKAQVKMLEAEEKANKMLARLTRSLLTGTTKADLMKTYEKSSRPFRKSKNMMKKPLKKTITVDDFRRKYRKLSIRLLVSAVTLSISDMSDVPFKYDIECCSKPMALPHRRPLEYLYSIEHIDELLARLSPDGGEGKTDISPCREVLVEEPRHEQVENFMRFAKTVMAVENPDEKYRNLVRFTRLTDDEVRKVREFVEANQQNGPCRYDLWPSIERYAKELVAARPSEVVYGMMGIPSQSHLSELPSEFPARPIGMGKTQYASMILERERDFVPEQAHDWLEKEKKKGGSVWKSDSDKKKNLATSSYSKKRR